MNKTATILIANDDDNDRFLVKSALEECRIANPVFFVKDGDSLMDCLCQNEMAVGLILLDLNMTFMNGREVLKAIKLDKRWRKIPVVILTTSKSAKDVEDCYAMGANSYVVKPTSHSVFNDTIATLVRFWFELSQLPISSSEVTKIAY